MTNDATGASKRQIWNPFRTFADEADARRAARAGVVVSLYLLVSYLVQAVALYQDARDTLDSAGMGAALSVVLPVAFAAFLTWTIWRHQRFWAAIVVAVWIVLEIGLKALMTLSGAASANVIFYVMLVVCAVATIMAVRGSFALGAMREEKR
jgi:hypothetical protein